MEAVEKEEEIISRYSPQQIEKRVKRVLAMSEEELEELALNETTFSRNEGERATVTSFV